MTFNPYRTQLPSSHTLNDTVHHLVYPHFSSVFENVGKWVEGSMEFYL